MIQAPEMTSAERLALAELERRAGRLYVRQRLGLERDYEASFRRPKHVLDIENWLITPTLIRGCLRLMCLHERGRRNALDIQVRHHEVSLPSLHPAFEGFMLLQLSDLHVDMNLEFIPALI